MYIYIYVYIYIYIYITRIYLYIDILIYIYIYLFIYVLYEYIYIYVLYEYIYICIIWIYIYIHITHLIPYIHGVFQRTGSRTYSESDASPSGHHIFSKRDLCEFIFQTTCHHLGLWLTERHFWISGRSTTATTAWSMMSRTAGVGWRLVLNCTASDRS